ncbi:DUF2164 domain-containing protein [Neptuniibacter marinus]|uniref:DUF2164 domain-containing protein n=1 Tax=Neptuniibacter marinus TaxID=1806670 RepID=UPI00082DB434|nr:DUF2164 domain-containing protein [Neptuniibacter marinus]
MSEIKFSTDEKALLVAKLKSYFEKEMEQDIGQFECEFLLDFISKEFGAHYYNKGLSDAQLIVSQKLEDISDAFYEMEKVTPS